jgi:tetratricopeptide (TPR) repeat protein
VTTALVGLVLTGAVSCSRSHAAGDGGTDGAPALVLRTPPTTAPSIAIGNLDAEIADKEKRMARGEPDAGFDLVARYLARAQFEGRVADLVRADETSASLVATRGGELRAHLTRASALSSIHDFAAALGELDAVAPHNPAEVWTVSQQRGSLLLATGREEEAAKLLRLREGAPPDEFVMRAGVEARLGNAGEAERLFDLARTHYHDVSPIMWTWMDFERARALELAGNRRDAKVYLEEAVKILPTYAHAVVHLAALQPPDVALKQLEALAKTSDDPDVLAGQADALRRAGRADEGKAVAARAAARYAEVLARLPLAYADHAASFYLGMGGDPARALDLAKHNADNRPTDEAIELWLTAAQAAGSKDATCAAAGKALGRPHASQELRDRATAARKGCP